MHKELYSEILTKTEHVFFRALLEFPMNGVETAHVYLAHAEFQTH